MYSIYADDICIYNDAFLLEDMKVADPKLTLEDSAAGSLTLTLPPSNKGYDTITRLVTDISVRKDGEEIWEGRVLDESTDFYNNRVLTCEGALAFFNDTTQPPAEYHDMTVRGFLETLIEIHNAKVAENRQFTVGVVTVTDSNDSLYRYTNNEKTIECINEKLVDRLGGHLRTRREDGVRYLDYLADYPTTTSQKIEFGKNLLDFTRTWDMSEFATVVVPLGNQLEESDIEALTSYLTVESVNNGSMYVENSDAVAAYGWIETVVNWDDVSTASALLTKAKEYLADIQFDNLTIELSAIDLHYLDSTVEDVKLLDQIRVVSVPHGLDRYFPVTKLEIPLAEPENTQFTLGDDIKTSLTDVNNSVNTDILNRINNLPTKASVLTEAKANATAIMNSAVTGYITIAQDKYGSETLYISDDRDYTAATRLWKWTLNGLAYSSDGGKTYSLAMTMDGAIVADFITTGTLNADLIKTGTLQDTNSNVIFNLSTGSLTMKKGSINIGDGVFKVTTSGALTATNATLTGTLTTSSGSYSAKLTSAALYFYYDDTEKGSFAGSVWSGTSLYGIAMHLTSSNYFISFSRDSDGDGTYEAAYYICYASSISSYTHNFNGTEYHSGAATFSSGVKGNSTALSLIGPSYTVRLASDAFYPATNNVLMLGSSNGYRWTAVYATSGTISTSDRNEKHDINDISEKYVEFFKLIRPVTYMRNGGDRIHVGMISQEILEAMVTVGLSPEDFGGFCRDAKVGYSEYAADGSPIESSKYTITDDEGNTEYSYALRYEEFTGLCIYMIQQLLARVEALEADAG